MSTGDPVSSSPRVGATLRGKWTLEKLIGEGGMATVYVARHKIGRLDAIKILHPALAATPQLRARFEQEAHVVNRFRHRGAVEVRDIDTTEDGAPFIVMELLEGETLSAISRRTGGPLEVAMVLQMADEVLDVLAAAHAQGIIHRDIKPDNLLRLTDGHMKVLDFGIARMKEGMSGDLRTRTGTTLGTVAYMPPEQAKGIEIDGRADLYAVGATMFRLLSGRRVHEADTEAERFVKVVSDPAPPLASVTPGVPAHVCAVVDRALAFDREQRYPDAATMQADVRAAARGEAPKVTPPSPPAVKEAPTRAEAPIRPPPPPLARAPVDAPTRAAPGVAQQLPTVAQQVAPFPAMMPTAATRPVAPPVAPAPMPPSVAASPPAPVTNRRLVIILAIAAAAFVAVILAIALVALSGSGSNATPSASSASNTSATATQATPPNEAPTAVPTHGTPTTTPPPAPPPAPGPPGRHGHGNGR